MSVYRPLCPKLPMSKSVKRTIKKKCLWFIRSTDTGTFKVSLSVINTFSSVYGHHWLQPAKSSLSNPFSLGRYMFRELSSMVYIDVLSCLKKLASVKSSGQKVFLSDKNFAEQVRYHTTDFQFSSHKKTPHTCLYEEQHSYEVEV